MHDKTSPEQIAPHIINKLPYWSPAFYERAKNDPLSFADENSNARPRMRQLDIDGLAYATNHRDTRETAEFAADLAYLGFLEDTNDVRAYATIATDAITERLKANNLKPSEKTGLWIRLLDMTSLQALDGYQRAAISLDAAGKSNALALLEANSKAVIQKGAVILSEMQSSLAMLDGAKKAWEEDERKLLVGKMFELVYITNRRRELYDSEQYDEVLILGATEFQDRPAFAFSPNHNFDVMEISAAGEVKELAQCKAGENGDVYEHPIRKVSGQSMKKFFTNPAPFIDAIDLVVSNDPMVSESAMKQSVEIINSLFKREERSIGEQAVRAAVINT